MVIFQITLPFGSGHSISETFGSQSSGSFMFLCLAGVLVPDLTNVTLGRLQLHFIDRSDDNIDVLSTYRIQFDRMVADLTKINEKKIKTQAEIYHIDSTNLKNLNISDKIDFVITSPPYPNRYSYVWNTRPFLYLFDFKFSTAVWVGFIALFGIATDNAVVLLSTLEDLFKARMPVRLGGRGEPQGIENIRKTVVEAGLLRIRPAVMTTTTTVLALLPVMLSTGSGSEVMKPMASPIFGGLLFATISNLMLVPVL